MVDGASTYFSPKNVSSFYEWEVRATRTRGSCGGKSGAESPENQGEKRKRTVHIKYAFPISVYLVFHFLFYVCPDKQPNTDSNN